jgi:hypothetical protein
VQKHWPRTGATKCDLRHTSLFCNFDFGENFGILIVVKKDNININTSSSIYFIRSGKSRPVLFIVSPRYYPLKSICVLPTQCAMTVTPIFFKSRSCSVF